MTYIPVWLRGDIVYVMWHQGVPCPLRVGMRHGGVLVTEDGTVIGKRRAS